MTTMDALLNGFSGGSAQPLNGRILNTRWRSTIEILKKLLQFCLLQCLHTTYSGSVCNDTKILKMHPKGLPTFIKKFTFKYYKNLIFVYHTTSEIKTSFDFVRSSYASPIMQKTQHSKSKLFLLV